MGGSRWDKIAAVMEHPRRPRSPIVLIGGSNGSGKTHLSRKLSEALGIDHRIGTGFLREVVRSESSPEREPTLFTFSFQPPDPVGVLRWQAERLRPAIHACIARARAEGTSLVIEGTHLLPDLFAGHPDIDAYLVLRTPRVAEVHQGRLVGGSHLLRQLSARDHEAIATIDRHYADRAGDAPVLEFHDNLDEIIERLGLG